ncbi:MAG: hypothetical protein HOV81_18140 [Kofleriaceae bacterium]|nr:hypothetical protein [Kofleriaceae bacterium]
MGKYFGTPLTYLALSTALVSVGCGTDEIDSDEAARRAYLAMDASIGKSITLGFQGFNAASSANIDAQTMTATTAGMITVTGQVDQGSSANKGMRLKVGMVGYDDGPVAYNDDGDTVHVVFDTDADPTLQPALTMQLKNIPTGTLEGSIMGVYHLAGDLEGDLTLNVTFTGTLMAGTGTEVLRVPGSTMVTGTATNADGGVYNVTLTL